MSHTQFEHSGRNTEVNNAGGKTADLDNKLANHALDILMNAGRHYSAAENSSKSVTAKMVDNLLNAPCERATVVTSGGASNPAVLNEKGASESSIGRAVASGAIAGSILGGAIASGAGATARKAAIEGASAAGKAAIEGASAAGRNLSNGYEAGIIAGKVVAEVIANGIGKGSVLSDIPTMPRNRANTPRENSSSLPPVIIKDGVLNIGPRNSESGNGEHKNPRSSEGPKENQTFKNRSSEEHDPGLKWKNDSEKDGAGKRSLQNKLPRSLSEILRDSLIYPRTYEP